MTLWFWVLGVFYQLWDDLQDWVSDIRERRQRAQRNRQASQAGPRLVQASPTRQRAQSLRDVHHVGRARPSTRHPQGDSAA
jgi:hypothetical protein